MAYKRFLALFGLILFALILSQISLASMYALLVRTNFFYLGISLMLLLAVLVLKALKWKTVLNIYSNEYSLFSCIKFWSIGFFLSVLTPGRVGDLSRALYVRDKVSLPQALLSVIVDRLMDVVLLLVWSLLAVFMFAYFFGQSIIPLPLLVGLFLALVVLAWFFAKEKNVKRILRPFFNYFVPAHLKEKIKLNFVNFYESLGALKQNKGALLKALLLGILSWGLTIVLAYFVVLALNLEIPALFMIVVIPLISLVDLIPISVSGLGTRDAALIFLFSFYALTAEAAVAFSLVYLLIGYFLVAFLGFLFFVRQPVQLNIFKDN